MEEGSQSRLVREDGAREQGGYGLCGVLGGGSMGVNSLRHCVTVIGAFGWGHW